jgi:hypothetical protein
MYTAQVLSCCALVATRALCLSSWLLKPSGPRLRLQIKQSTHQKLEPHSSASFTLLSMLRRECGAATKAAAARPGDCGCGGGEGERDASCASACRGVPARGEAGASDASRLEGRATSSEPGRRKEPRAALRRAGIW